MVVEPEADKRAINEGQSMSDTQISRPNAAFRVVTLMWAEVSVTVAAVLLATESSVHAALGVVAPGDLAAKPRKQSAVIFGVFPAKGGGR